MIKNTNLSNRFLLATMLLALALFSVRPVFAHDHSMDNDSDHDGVVDAEDSSPDDHDDDGIDDADEVDDDHDMYPDCIEKLAFRLDEDNDGKRDKDDDVDSSSELDTSDHDADGIPDVVERGRFRNNHDNAGRKDPLDLDDDNDGIIDRTETRKLRHDHDNDRVKDDVDSDDDNDGTEDYLEVSCHGGQDHDNDGIRDRKDEVDDSEDASTNQDIREAELVEIEIDDHAFDPSELSIVVGDSIKITNNDSVSHTFTDADGSFNTGTLAPGESETITFDTVGEFSFYCALHPDMTGSLMVMSLE